VAADTVTAEPSSKRLRTKAAKKLKPVTHFADPGPSTQSSPAACAEKDPHIDTVWRRYLESAIAKNNMKVLLMNEQLEQLKEVRAKSQTDHLE
jgi:hypothetical protein